MGFQSRDFSFTGFFCFITKRTWSALPLSYRGANRYYFHKKEFINQFDFSLKSQPNILKAIRDKFTNMSLFVSLAEYLSKLHFLFSLAMFFFIAIMVVSDDLTTRALLLLPVVLLFSLSKIMYSIDQKTSTDAIIKKYKKRTRNI